MEVHYFTCDFCGRKIEEGKRIAATMQRIRRTPEYKFKFDMCIDCYELLKRKAVMGGSHEELERRGKAEAFLEKERAAIALSAAAVSTALSYGYW